MSEFENPTLVNYGPREELRENSVEDDEEPEREVLMDFANVPECSLPPLDTEKQLRNILDCILPPRRIESDDGLTVWRERASTQPSTRIDLIALEERLDAELKAKGAKGYGVDPIRRALYDQLFDELIRQVTVNCAERGLLLLRVRDELRMTILAYQSLLESATAYGLRKAIAVENEQSKAIVERDEERAKNQELQIKIVQLEKKIANDRLVNEEELELLQQRMREENERLAESNKTLKHQLQALLQMDQINANAAVVAPAAAALSQHEEATAAMASYQHNYYRNNYENGGGRGGGGYYPRWERINEDDVPESKHSVFIRGFPGDIAMREIESFFAENVGPVSFDFHKVTADRTKLFVAVRFQSREQARDCMDKYKDGEILGHPVQLSWFKDVRRFAAYQQQVTTPRSYSSSHRPFRGGSNQRFDTTHYVRPGYVRGRGRGGFNPRYVTNNHYDRHRAHSRERSRSPPSRSRSPPSRSPSSRRSSERSRRRTDSRASSRDHRRRSSTRSSSPEPPRKKRKSEKKRYSPVSVSSLSSCSSKHRSRSNSAEESDLEDGESRSVSPPSHRRNHRSLSNESGARSVNNSPDLNTSVPMNIKAPASNQGVDGTKNKTETRKDDDELLSITVEYNENQQVNKVIRKKPELLPPPPPSYKEERKASVPPKRLSEVNLLPPPPAKTDSPEPERTVQSSPKGYTRSTYTLEDNDPQFPLTSRLLSSLLEQQNILLLTLKPKIVQETKPSGVGRLRRMGDKLAEKRREEMLKALSNEQLQIVNAKAKLLESEFKEDCDTHAYVVSALLGKDTTLETKLRFAFKEVLDDIHRKFLEAIDAFILECFQSTHCM